MLSIDDCWIVQLGDTKPLVYICSYRPSRLPVLAAKSSRTGEPARKKTVLTDLTRPPRVKRPRKPRRLVRPDKLALTLPVECQNPGPTDPDRSKRIFTPFLPNVYTSPNVGENADGMAVASVRSESRKRPLSVLPQMRRACHLRIVRR